MTIVDSKINAVTVFTDRAQITREATVELEQGEHTLVFDKLPQSLIQQSIQVNGTGNAVLTNVKFTQEHYEVIPDESKQFLYDEKIRIEDEMRVLDEQLERLNKEKQLIENLAHTLTNASQEHPQKPELDPEKWLKMINFYKENLEKIDLAHFDIEKSKRNIQAKLQKIRKQIQDLGRLQNQKTKNRVEVLVEMKSTGTLQLALSYIVMQASWKPIYDLRVSSEDKKMQITYNALVFQNTSENWEDCNLQLSTAQPQISGKQPEMQPWRIQMHQPVFGGNRGGGGPGMSNMMASLPKQMFKKEMKEMAMDDAEPESAFEEEKEISIESSTIETRASSVTFHIAGSHTIQSDGTEQKVNITVEDFAAYFRYSTVPKLSPYAYLKAKVKNETAFPFLAGESNVFLDNHFVANSVIEAVAPSEEFWTFLGIDEGFKVEHKFLKKYEKKEGGVFSKKQKVLVYEYEIEITNHKASKEEIVVWDQLPISQNEAIKVNLLEPKYKEDTAQLKKNEYDYLEWFFDMEAGTKVNVPFKFSVEFPQDKQLEGLA